MLFIFIFMRRFLNFNVLVYIFIYKKFIYKEFKLVEILIDLMIKFQY